MPFFASPAEQSTAGTRGKTTRRKATKTVRGNEGAYIAAAKDELTARPPVAAFRVTTVIAYPDSTSRVVEIRGTRAEADELVARCQKMNASAAGVTSYQIDDVLVVWVMEGGQCVRRVVE